MLPPATSPASDRPSVSPRRFPACPLRGVLDLIGDTWSVLVLFQLWGGAKRYAELKRAVEGISPRMLAKTLRALEENGFVARRVFATVPPQVEYSLTELGRSFLERFGGLVKWTDENRGQIERARADYADRVGEALPPK